MLKSIVLFLVLEAAGFAAVFYAFPMVRLFGHMDWAERYLGSGSTYAVWRLAGIVSIIAGFFVLRYGYAVLSGG